MITRSKSRQLQQQTKTVSTAVYHPPVAPSLPAKPSQNLQNIVYDDFYMLESDQDMIIEGLKYSDIEQNAVQKSYLESLRANLPQYSNMSSQRKSWYFRNLSNEYNKNVNGNNIEQVDNRDNRRVTFEDNQKYKAFDKHESPHRVGFLEEQHDFTKF